MPDPKRPIRLAMRQEGDWWVAYVATTESMQGAFEIGRIAMGAARDPQVKDAFLAVMVQVLQGNLEAMGLTPLSWETRSAPESERAGRA